MKTLTFTRAHDLAQLADELAAKDANGNLLIPSLAPRRVQMGALGVQDVATWRASGDGQTLTLEVPDSADEAAVRAIVQAHVPQPRGAATDRKKLFADFKAAKGAARDALLEKLLETIIGS
jgi:hypothetical protein